MVARGGGRERGRGRGPTKLYVYKSVCGGTVCTAGHKSHWLPSEVYTLSTPAETNGENQYQTKCVQTSKLWTEISPSQPCESCLIVQTFIIIQRNSFTVGSLVLSKEKWNKKKPNKEIQNFLWLWGFLLFYRLNVPLSEPAGQFRFETNNNNWHH